MAPNISCPSVIKQKTVVLRKFSCVSSSILTRNDNTNTNVTSKKYATPCDAGCFWAYGLCRKKSTCTCLPPPCNIPPRCLQYMTGYYYYPYGTWFCGPYHAVGPCPVSANGPACPCPKCCVACVCPNNAENRNWKSETAVDQSKIQDSYPAKINCQTSPRLQAQKDEFELFRVKNSDKKYSESKQEKNVPPGLASMIYPNSNRPNDALGAVHNAMKRNLAKRTQKAISSPTSKTKDIKFHKEMIEFNGQPSKSVSCPTFKNLGSTRQNLTLRRTASISHIKEHKAFFQKCRLLQNYVENNVLQIRAVSTNATEKSVNAAKNIGSVCACPVPSSCLPPPCNTPAKCLQYMTGYYYYPYGTWFCGPYHVSTGSCPCAGPVKPGGSCGPVLPCPGDQCGPICCKPLSCCGVCGVGGPFQSSTSNNAYNPWQFGSTNMYTSYNLYPPNPYMEYNSYYPYNPYTPSGYYNGYNGTPPNFGQCYNVPISPIPVTHPMTSESCQTNTESSAPKSSICWPLSKVNINQDTKVSSYKVAVSNAPSTKNITPKPMRFSPSSSYDSKPAVSKTNPYTKPRINARTFQQSNSIGICYFSTKCIEKYANKGKKISTYNLPHGIGPRKLSRATRTVTEEAKVLKHISFNYWSLLSDGNKRQE